MKRFRVAVPVIFGAAAVLALGSAGVFAGSKTTYSNHALAASGYIGNGDHAAKPGQVGSWEWLGYEQSANWRFDAAQLAAAINKSVMLNITALSTNGNLGSGYSTALKVTVTGTGTASFSVTLANPWKPHIAHNATPGVGWQAYATVNVPKSVYTGAHSLRVRIAPTTRGNIVGVNQSAILIGYATTP